MNTNKTLAPENFEQNFDFQHFLVKNTTATYFFRVGSDAMVDIGIQTGDRLVVDRSVKFKNRDIVVTVNQGQFLVRRLIISQNKILLLAENDNFSPITVGDERLLDVWGVVVGLVRKY